MAGGQQSTPGLCYSAVLLLMAVVLLPDMAVAAETLHITDCIPANASLELSTKCQCFAGAVGGRTCFDTAAHRNSLVCIRLDTFPTGQTFENIGCL